jgi:BirA family transcriptional regulator, biotin operon repressor / biotin---[acetyl-CoA-carboxylase] ligase
VAGLPPDPVSDLPSAAEIERGLPTRRLGHPTLFFAQVGSTNDVAHEQAAAGAGDGLLVLAEEQTAGRGRQAHTWWAPPQTSLLMSLLLRPSSPAGSPLPAGRAGQLTMCLGLGAVEGIERLTGLRPALKWPNDVLLAERKLGGMLTELRLAGEGLAYAVLGLGLNVNLLWAEDGPITPAQAELARTSTSLLMALGYPLPRLPLLAAILARTEVWYERVLAGQSPYEAWSARLDTLGRRVRVTWQGGSLEGIATGAAPDGALLVRDDQGQTHTVWSGDVTSLRSTSGS